MPAIRRPRDRRDHGRLALRAETLVPPEAKRRGALRGSKGDNNGASDRARISSDTRSPVSRCTWHPYDTRCHTPIAAHRHCRAAAGGSTTRKPRFRRRRRQTTPRTETERESEKDEMSSSHKPTVTSVTLIRNADATWFACVNTDTSGQVRSADLLPDLAAALEFTIYHQQVFEHGTEPEELRTAQLGKAVNELSQSLSEPKETQESPARQRPRPKRRK